MKLNFCSLKDLPSEIIISTAQPQGADFHVARGNSGHRRIIMISLHSFILYYCQWNFAYIWDTVPLKSNHNS